MVGFPFKLGRYLPAAFAIAICAGFTTTTVTIYENKNNLIGI